MKQKLSAAFLCFALLLTLMLDTAESRAATIYFTAANDTLLELSDSTMPFWSGGLLYVPASVFDSGGLDFSVSYNSAKKTLILRQSQYRLICNLSSGMNADSNGNSYDFVPLERNGVVFLPINAVCRILGLSCVTRTVSKGNLVRIRSSAASLSDEAFLSAAAPMINSLYAAYQSAKRPTDESSDSDQRRYLYLTLTVRSAEQLDQWLNACTGTAHRLTFFLTEEFLQKDAPHAADLLRRALAEGHVFGLTTDASTSRSALEVLQRANRSLSELTCTKTRITAVRTQARKGVTEAGYCTVSFDRSLDAASDLTSSESYQLLSGLSSGARLDLGDSLTAPSLRTLLSRAAARGFTARGLREPAC